MVKKAKKFIYAKRYKGFPVLENFRLVEEDLPDLNDGEILCEAEFLSIDPYMRVFHIDIGSTMIGGQIARIIESKNAQYPIGSYIFGQLGWRTHTIIDPGMPQNKKILMYLLPNFEGLPLSLGLGALGMPGATAYFGLIEVCQPRPEETVVITSAAGAVGSLVGQIAKIIGCKVIGITGTDEKCTWLKNDLGFDEAINYKNNDLSEELKKAAPQGVDCYFDNVGGDISPIIISQMNPHGCVAVCGSISTYNHEKRERPKEVNLHRSNAKQIKMKNLSYFANWADRQLEATAAMQKWIIEGKLKCRETITEGFENMPKAFIELMEGKSIGKSIVKV